MSLKKISTIAALIAGVVFTQAAGATVITFDDLTGRFPSLPAGYGGFTWSNASAGIGGFDGLTSSGGWYKGVVSGHYMVYNLFGYSGNDIQTADSSAFTFNGAYFTDTGSTQSISFIGKLDGHVVYTSSAFSINSTTPTFISLNWSGIDELIINNTGHQWAMDNFTFNNATAAPVSEPASLALLGLGLAGFLAKRRRKG